jgi:ribulose-phosphate 3-epimerase
VSAGRAGRGDARGTLRARARGLSLGLYAGDLAALGETARTAAARGARILHFDEMDGRFVPAFLGGAPLVAAVRRAVPDALLDVHLMHARPAPLVAAYAGAGADLITVHAEAEGAAEALDAIRAAERPVLAGLALMPGTRPDMALLERADLVLVLALDPRDGSKPDISAACARVRTLANSTIPTNPLVALDGGVTLESIGEIAAARPDMIVSGSAVLKAADPAGAFARMHAAWQDTQDSQDSQDSLQSA